MKNEGKFFVDYDLIYSTDYELLQEIFYGIVVLRTEIYPGGRILYWAICSDFEPVKEGYPIPLYEMIVETADNKTLVKRTFKKSSEDYFDLSKYF